MQGGLNGSVSLLSILRLVACIGWTRASIRRVRHTWPSFSQRFSRCGKRTERCVFIGGSIMMEDKTLASMLWTAVGICQAILFYA